MGIVSTSLHHLHLGWIRLSGKSQNYRQHLWEELKDYQPGKKFSRILEIGPKDGEDTRRLLSLKPDKLVLLELPDKKEILEKKTADLQGAFELHIGNFMYEDLNIGFFDLVWCTGVLYHNPEQLRMIRQLFDFVKPGGLLVIESATARRCKLRDEACVEIWHNVEKSIMRCHHVSTNVTHLPSRRAIHAWLEMVGFAEIRLSSCHRRVTRRLGHNRAAFIARRPEVDRPHGYYSIAGLNYDIGKAR